MTVELADVGRDRAPEGVRLPDVYFTAGYGHAAATMDGGSWRISHCEERILVPYVVRDIPAGGRDAISPYGYSGVHVDPTCDPVQVGAFWRAALAHWRDAGLVTMFLRFSPLDPYSVEVVRELPGVRLSGPRTTVTVPVDRGAPHAWTAMEGRSRTAVRKAARAGMDAVIRPASTADTVAGSPFRRLYEQTMRRVGSAPGYLFSDTHYRRLSDGLGKDLLIVEVRGRDGEVVSAALVLRHADRAHYHLAGSRPEAAREGANNLLVWTILEWAADSGCRQVHLGGGVRPDDGLFQFKRSFGGERTRYWTGGVVIDPARYDRLLAATGVGPAGAADFFPGYRAGGR
ncbi:MAG TPA: GNAT family N-acetyltransferase [Micromonospora sp.]